MKWLSLASHTAFNREASACAEAAAARQRADQPAPAAGTIGIQCAA
jgi:hypothetical protein